MITLPDNQENKYIIVDLSIVSGATAPVMHSIYNASNLTDEGLFSHKSGSTLYFKGLSAGDNITLIPTSTGITINSIGGMTGDFVSASTFNQYTGDTRLELDGLSTTLGTHTNQLSTIEGLYITGTTNGLRKLSKRRVALGGALTGTTTFTGATARIDFGTTTNRLSQFNVGFASQLQFYSSASLYQAMSSTGWVLNTAASKALTFDTTLGNGLNILDTPASTNTSIRGLVLQRGSSGTAAKGIGVGIGFSVQNNVAAQSHSGILSHRLTNVSSTALSSAWKFTGYDGGNGVSSVDILEFAASGSSFNTRGLAIGTVLNPQSSSILDLVATDKTLTLPRIATEGNVTTPANGMLYYNSTLNKFRIRQNSNWYSVLDSNLFNTYTGSTSTNLDGKLNVLLSQRNIVGSSYTLTNSDSGQRLYLTGSTSTINLPTGLNSGFQVEIMKESTTGTTVTITPNGGVTLRSVNGVTKMKDQYGVCLIVHKGGDVFTAHGNLIT